MPCYLKLYRKTLYISAYTFLKFCPSFNSVSHFCSHTDEYYAVDEKQNSNVVSKKEPSIIAKLVHMSHQKDLTNASSSLINRPFRVSVEGNIGAGKSTLIDFFSKLPGIETFKEPIEKWKNCHNHNLLELLYQDPKKWYFTFQMYAQLTRLQMQLTPPKDSSIITQIFERSIQNNRFCFLEQALKSGVLHPAEYSISDKWYNQLFKMYDVTVDLIVYLRSSPTVVFERIKRRGRPEEKNITLDFLQQLHEFHENWLITDKFSDKDPPVLVLNANSTLDEIRKIYKNNEDIILGKDIIKKIRD